MKRLLLSIALVLGLSALASAQTFEALTNPTVIAGGKYLLSDPGPDLKRVQFFLTANIAGIKLPAPLDDCYAGGAGVSLESVNTAFGEVTGAGVSVPGITCYPKGGQFAVQVGWSKQVLGADKPDGIYAGLGFGVTSPLKLAAKRKAKAEKKAAEELRDWLLKQRRVTENK